MVAAIVVALLALVGAGFLVAASYMALKLVYSAAIAAALVGGGLVLIAGFFWLVVEAVANRRHGRGTIAPLAAVGAEPGNEAAEHIVAALKQESPLATLAAAAGLLVGLFLRGRHD